MKHEAAAANDRQQRARDHLAFELWKYRLSARDCSIVEGLAQNKTHVVLAAELGISQKTVQRSIAKWCKKLGFASADDLILKWKLDPQNAGRFLTGKLRAGAGGSDMVQLLGSAAARKTKRAAPQSHSISPIATRMAATLPEPILDEDALLEQTQLPIKTSPWLNPLFWSDVVNHLRDLKLQRMSLPTKGYCELDDLLWRLPTQRFVSSDHFNIRHAQYPRIWLLAALTARAMGAPFTREITCHERDYLIDCGSTFRERCRREDLFTLDLSEGLVSPENGIAFWTAMYPTLLRHTRRPNELRSIGLALRNSLCPIVGMVAQTFALSSLLDDSLNQNETKTPWLLLCRHIAAKRIALVKAHSLPIDQLCDWSSKHAT